VKPFITSRVKINLLSTPPFRPILEFDLDDIVQKLDAYRADYNDEPQEIILNLPSGDRIYGIPIRWAMEEKE